MPIYLSTCLGPLGVFLLMVPESACIPVPSEVTLLAAGFAVRQHWMAFWMAVAAATAGNLVGSLLAYMLGRLATSRVALGWMQPALHRCDALFSKHRTRAVFVARLMPLARTFVSLPAGYARVGLARFILMTTLGCAIWAAAFVVLGVLVGSGWRALSAALAVPMLVLGATVILVALLRKPSEPRNAARP